MISCDRTRFCCCLTGTQGSIRIAEKVWGGESSSKKQRRCSLRLVFLFSLNLTAGRPDVNRGLQTFGSTSDALCVTSAKMRENFLTIFCIKKFAKHR